MRIMAVAINYFPIAPAWTIALVGLALVALLAHGSSVLLAKRIPARWVAGLAALRTFAIVLFLLALLRPAIAYTRSTEQKKDLLVLVDTSRSMTGVDASPGKPRLAELRERMKLSGLEERLARSFDLDWFAFDVKSRGIDPAALEQKISGVDGTDLEQSLITALDQYRARRMTDSGDEAAATPDVLLMSDGNHLGGGDVVARARQLGVRVSTLAPADPAAHPAADDRIELTSLQAPPRVLAGSVCRFVAAATRTGSEPATAELILAEDGKTISRRTLTFAAGQREMNAELFHRPSELGTRRYRLSLVAASKDKTAPLGKPLELPIQVLGRGVNVLAIEDSIRWEFKFFKRILEDDPNFALTSFLSRGQGVYMQSVEADNSLRLGGLPQSRAELEYFDIIVLGDIRPKNWPPNLASAIHHAVVEQGKSLIQIAGSHLDQVAAIEELSTLLPVELAQRAGQPIEGPIAVQLVVGRSAFSPFFALDSAAARDLPPLDQIYPIVRKRPAATPLLEAADRAAAYGNLLVMAEHTVGSGRVLFVASDTLWKWQTLGKVDDAGNTPYRRFWQQTLRAMAPARPGSNQHQLVITADRSRYRVGDAVHLTATLAGQARGSSQNIDCRVRLPKGREFPLAFAPQSRDTSTYESDFEITAPGEHTIKATVSGGGKSAGETLLVITAAPQPSELEHARTNHRLLSALAAATGGREVDLDHKETWPGADIAKPVLVEQAAIVDLWSNFSLLLALVGVLGLDWLLRLLKGFV